MAEYIAENIREMNMTITGANARHYHKIAVEMRLRGQDGHEIWEAESRASLENLAMMRSAVLRAAQDLTARFQSMPANATTEKMVGKYMALVEHADTYLGG